MVINFMGWDMARRVSFMAIGEYDWIAVLIKSFLEIYDKDGSMLCALTATARISSTNTKVFVQWLKGEGWSIAYWDVDSFVTGSLWGIRINEDCPMLLEHKLRVM
jgi:hypothetical protein